MDSGLGIRQRLGGHRSGNIGQPRDKCAKHATMQRALQHSQRTAQDSFDAFKAVQTLVELGSLPHRRKCKPRQMRLPEGRLAHFDCHLRSRVCPVHGVNAGVYRERNQRARRRSKGGTASQIDTDAKWMQTLVATVPRWRIRFQQERLAGAAIDGARSGTG